VSTIVPWVICLLHLVGAVALSRPLEAVSDTRADHHLTREGALDLQAENWLPEPWIGLENELTPESKAPRKSPAGRLLLRRRIEAQRSLRSLKIHESQVLLRRACLVSRRLYPLKMGGSDTSPEGDPTA
jgi:hypothetical protein